MRAVSLFFILLFLIPPGAILYHDISHVYGKDLQDVQDPEDLKDINVERFSLSEAKWFWMKYHGDSLKTIQEGSSEHVWTGIIEPILSQKTILLASIPLILCIIVMIIIRILNTGPYQETKTSNVRKYTRK